MTVGLIKKACPPADCSTNAIGGSCRGLGLVWLALVVVVGPTVPLLAQPPTRIELQEHEGRQVFVVCGIAKPLVALVQNSDAHETTLASLLRVSVHADGLLAQPPMLGNHRFDNGRLVFEPRFPLRPGVTYRAVFDSTCLAPTGASHRPARGTVLERRFILSKATSAATTEVQGIYPSGDTLPENQLKFYVQFSAPMAIGDADQHVRLLDDSGQEIDLPFVNVGQELWNRQGTRITLLLDPGRIKRGLKPREDLGPILREGHSYTLVIDDSWHDASGRPLARPSRKKFRVAAPDDTQPDASRWRVHAPRADTRIPLRIDFREPLDHAMLQRVLEVVDGQAHPVAGTVELENNDQSWLFTPDTDWTAGPHKIIVDTTLEDLAGNSLGRPFEVDVFEEITTVIEQARISIPFGVR